MTEVPPLDWEGRPRELIVNRRSLYLVKNMAASDIVTPVHTRSICPRYGLQPMYYNWLIAKRVNQDIKPGTAVFLKVIG
ncbi:hypothetical protein L3556_01355 [Candidatus Synechococcus calcipolaris G9]|uniref:Uncharacterized protein n=1 Tax=Candidatus Synechococcus calcipolaris G9 TaxID=1497997 RepID=A0ABT6EVN7_9SYNE|nr:hypothetical protein [Candidatus Synechococcus calcipolaris]MDG2989584.1 hypothetical protein [Candidatus Synechococcus calcipolaris G9]